jgi:hypothetical protein
MVEVVSSLVSLRPFTVGAPQRASRFAGMA